MMHATLRIALLLALCLLPRAAAASALDLYGYNPRAIAMGGAQTALADDHTAAYYNPALLTQQTLLQFGYGVSGYLAELEIDRKSEGSEVDHALPPTYSGLSVGILFPLGGRVDNRLGLGLSLYLPTSRLIRLQTLDPVVPQYYMYQSLPERLALFLALGLKIVDEVSVGAGLQVLAQLSGRADISLDVVNRKVSRKTVQVDLTPNAGPVAGLAVHPFSWLSFGASYRGALQLNFELPVALRLEGIEVQAPVFIRGVGHYSPHQFTFGLAARPDIGATKLTLAFDLTVALWSKAPDPSLRVEANLGGSDLEALGLGEAIDLPGEGRERRVRLGFEDIAIPRFGVEWEPIWWARLRTGYFYRPTPAPVPRSAGANYIDNDAHGLSLGAGFTFPDPLEVFDRPVRADLAGMITVLEPRRVLKDDPASDPVGDYEARGAVYTLSVAIRHEY